MTMLRRPSGAEAIQAGLQRIPSSRADRDPTPAQPPPPKWHAGLAAGGMVKTARHQGVAAMQVADPARAPRAAAFTEALEIREDTRAVLRDFFIASGVPPERLVAGAIDWYAIHYGRNA